MRDLTLRGRCFAAAGLAAVLVGVQIGERDFLRIGLVALVVPLVAWLLVRRTSRAVWVRRHVRAPQVEAGSTTEVLLELGPEGVRSGTLLVEERLPAAFGGSPRFTLEPMAPGSTELRRYRLRAQQRGRHEVGPLQVRVRDALGMVESRTTVGATSSVLVTPRTDVLPRVALHARRAGSGENRTRELMGAGTPDVSIREYRIGDDLRRIHWPSSARVDQLMVRQEESQWQSRCTVLIDNRRTSHRGTGTAGSLETAVRAAASLVRHLAGEDFEVQLVTATGDGGARGAGTADHLERLALLGATRREHLETGWLHDSHRGSMLVAVLGRLGEADRTVLGGLAAGGTACFGLVLDVDQWERDRGARTVEPATAALRGHGWQATTVGRETSLAAAWTELTR